MFQIDKDAVGHQPLLLPMGDVDLQRVLVIQPDARLPPIFNGPLFTVLVSDNELLLCTYSFLRKAQDVRDIKTYPKMAASCENVQSPHHQI